MLQKKFSKDDTSSSQDLCLRNTTVVPGDSIINMFFKDRLRRKRLKV